jgi:predicted Fe-Mo cluster-binding NifX family protein
MKVAITTQGHDIQSLVDPRFGRARWFVIADTETGTWEPIDNGANADASGGAGVQAGTTVAAHSVAAVITGNVGPNAHEVLAAAGIAVYRAGNGVTAQDALAALSQGALTALDKPTVKGHWA